MQQLDSGRRNQAGLFSWLGQDDVACSQSRRDLTQENSQGEVPGADAQHHTHRTVLIIIKVAQNLPGVIAQEVHGFTHFCNRIRIGLASFTHQQAHQVLHIVFQQLGGLLQGGGTLFYRRGLPNGRIVAGGFQSLLHILRGGVHDLPHYILMIGRIAHNRCLGLIPDRIALTQDRLSLTWQGSGLHQGGGQRAQAMLIA